MKYFQFRRSKTTYDNRTLAVTALQNQIPNLTDGEMIIASYHTNKGAANDKICYARGTFNAASKTLFIEDYQEIIDNFNSQNSEIEKRLDTLSGMSVTEVDSADNSIKPTKSKASDGTVKYDLASNVGIAYDKGKKILKLVTGNTNTVDASDFVKDGMIDSVTISDDKSAINIVWNTDAGKKDISIKIKDLIRLYKFESGTIIFNTTTDETTGIETISADIDKFDCGEF